MSIQKLINTLRYWLEGIRFYIGCAIVLTTVIVWWWSHVLYSGTNLAMIREQEVFAWLAVGMFMLAIMIGPFLKVFSELPGKQILFDARRLIGIGAAWFGLLHAGVTYASQFRWANPFSLADMYLRSLLLGVTALIIFLLMAFTSFDRAMQGLGIWWYRLHRLIYAAAFLAVLHAFMIGTHATGQYALIIVGILGSLLLGMHIYLVLKQPNPSKTQIITVILAVIFALAVFNYGLSQHLGYQPLLGQMQGAK
jgi:DMSO/TMAO reductase YedYZ heme-binding membrane subunit